MVTVEIIIHPEDREEFLVSVEQLRLNLLRNGAFLYRVDETLETPGTFRTEMLVASWADHLRQHGRMTKAETELAERVRAMHAVTKSRLCVITLGILPVDSARLQSIRKRARIPAYACART